MDIKKKAPLCPKLSRMTALLQGDGASSDGSTAVWPNHMLLFTFSISMLLALFHFWSFERKTYTWWSRKSSYFWFTQWKYPDKAKEKHMKSVRKAHEKCTLFEDHLQGI